MPRRKVPQIPELPYHLYNRVLDRAFYPSDHDLIWLNCLRLLRRCRELYPVRVHAFVLMGNHYHLIASCREGRVDRMAQHFQSHLSRWLVDHYGTQKYRFQTRYGRTLLPTPSLYLSVLRYVAQNPVRARIVRFCEDYEFSFRCPHLAKGHAEIFEPHPYQGMVARFEFAAWLNEAIPESKLETLRKGLGRSVFHNQGRSEERCESLASQAVGF